MPASELESQPQRYVYDNVEVIKTGRMAKKELRSGKVDELFEVTPVEAFDGTWKKWVRLSELFEVQ
jgi:hypothetical protein